MQESLMKCNTEDTDDGHPCPLHIITYITCKQKKEEPLVLLYLVAGVRLERATSRL